MTKKSTFSIHKAFDILLSLSFWVAGICLICGCLTIYFSGEQPYSREAVAEIFEKIAIPVYFCLFLTVISIIWQLISPKSRNTKTSFKDYTSLINKLSAKKDLAADNNDIFEAISKEKALRKTHMLIRTAIICVSSIVFLCYALNSANFHQTEINTSMIRAMLVMLPCLAVSFGYSVFTAYLNRNSYERELDLIKKLPASTNNASDEAVLKKCNSALIIKIALVIVALCIIIYGYFTGGTTDVLTKAINICTECIGLG